MLPPYNRNKGVQHYNIRNTSQNERISKLNILPDKFEENFFLCLPDLDKGMASRLETDVRSLFQMTISVHIYNFESTSTKHSKGPISKFAENKQSRPISLHLSDRRPPAMPTPFGDLIPNTRSRLLHEYIFIHR